MESLRALTHLLISMYRERLSNISTFDALLGAQCASNRIETRSDSNSCSCLQLDAIRRLFIMESTNMLSKPFITILRALLSIYSAINTSLGVHCAPIQHSFLIPLYQFASTSRCFSSRKKPSTLHFSGSNNDIRCCLASYQERAERNGRSGMKWGPKRIGKLDANNDADWEENRSHAGFSFSDAVILYAGLLNLAKQWRLAMGAGKRREFASFNGVALSRPSASHSTNFKIPVGRLWSMVSSTSYLNLSFLGLILKKCGCGYYRV